MKDVSFQDKPLLPGSPSGYKEPGTEPFDPLVAVGDASAQGGGSGSLGELEMLLQVSFHLQKCTNHQTDSNTQ